MHLSILIVNWNSKQYLKKCLLSIRDTCSVATPQVVVVDCGSYDGCSDMLADEFPAVVFVQCLENIGFGRSNNLGACKVTGDVLLLLNPDTELQSGAIDVLLENLYALPVAGVIGARLINSDGSMQLTSVHPLPTAWNAAFDCNWRRQRWWHQQRTYPNSKAFEVEAVSGACMMLRTETFIQLGGFDPRYFMYAEDMDLCLKIRRCGLKVYHAPQAEIIHHGGCSSRAQFSKFSAVMIHESIHLYLHTNIGCIQAALYRILMALSALIRMLVLIVAWLSNRHESCFDIRQSILKWWTVMRWCMGLERSALCRCSDLKKRPLWTTSASSDI